MTIPPQPIPTRPVRVLHIITRMIIGGAQENTMYSAAMLDKSLFQVDVICGPQTGSEGSLIEETLARGVNLTILPPLVREVHPINDLLALINLYFIIRRGNYHIVHTHSSKAGILGRLAAKMAGTPIILHTVHGWSFHDYMSVVKRNIYIFLERWTARYCQKIIVVTQADKEKGLKMKIGKAEQYHLIRSAIPLEEYQPNHIWKATLRQELGIPVDVPVIGTISRLSPQKNPLEWVKVAALISQQIPSAHFIIVGDGPLHQAVNELLQSEGLLQKTTLTGLRRDVGKILNTMDVILLTSLWEGLPRVIPESMSAGIPIVAYAVDGIKEIIQHRVNGLLCEPHNLQQAALECVELINNPALRAKLIHAGKQTAAEQFDLKQMIQGLQQLYLESMKRKASL